MEDFYEEGYSAYYDFRSIDDNPFYPGSVAYVEWERGWKYAEEENY